MEERLTQRTFCGIGETALTLMPNISISNEVPTRYYPMLRSIPSGEPFVKANEASESSPYVYVKLNENFLASDFKDNGRCVVLNLAEGVCETMDSYTEVIPHKRMDINITLENPSDYDNL